eukprot:TRINITY_DN20469_c0_g1_i1.p1 TRINITY_DN20469_c0_g1~~TRINITY_DN20469_c0_g1_i1.p1  ORF type:complete len:3252 (+),score=1021.98 TRINITY_DN20469_c0_g1_i1:67-9822(+)
MRNRRRGCGMPLRSGSAPAARDKPRPPAAAPLLLVAAAWAPRAAGQSVNVNTNTVSAAEGAAATFTVVLGSAPTDTVRLSVVSNDTYSGTVNPSLLTFTTGNWNTAQTVTVSMRDNNIQDGDAIVSITVGPPNTNDAAYAALAAVSVAATKTDNDNAAITVTPTTLVTKEDQSNAPVTFTVVLTSEPTAAVTISVSSSDTKEATVSASTLTFTALSWSVVQTVTVTSTQDSVDEAATIAYNVVLGPVTTTDPVYAAIDPADISCTNEDDDVAAVAVSPRSLVTSEQGPTSATFTVALATQPQYDVTIGLTQQTAAVGAAEGTLSTTALVFTAGTATGGKIAWSTAATVTVTGIDDSMDDGNQSYTIVTTAASTDTIYAAVTVADVAVVNMDDDQAGLNIVPTSGLTTTEQGGTAAFVARLTAQPASGTVQVELSSNDTTEGTVQPSTLTFTTANWDSLQQVVVTGVDDSEVDGNRVFAVTAKISTTSPPADNAYRSVADVQVLITNTDNDSVGIQLNVTTTSVLTTSEAGQAAWFTAHLSSQPAAGATVDWALTSSDETEGLALLPGCTTSGCKLSFTDANWDTLQTVTVSPQNDDLDDGTQKYTITVGPAVSTQDSNYNGLAAVVVNVENADDDESKVLISPSSITTTETGGAATVQVKLGAQPTADVTVAVTTTQTTEATVTAGASLVFTAANWNTDQPATITGMDDNIDDGDVSYSVIASVASSLDSTYATVPSAQVAATNTDNDTAGVTVTPTTGFVVHEAGSTTSFTVRLDSQPTADVTIAVRSDDISEGVITSPCASPGGCNLVFSSGTWAAGQQVVVKGEQDAVADGDVTFSVVVGAPTSADAKYAAITTSTTLSMQCIDDDTPGVSVTPAALNTSESGTTAAFAVVLHTQPTATVRIPVESADTTEGVVSTAELVFTSSNATTPSGANQWSTAQTVTVTGIDDSEADGDIQYDVLLKQCISTDTQYNTIDPTDVKVTNFDDDSVGVVIFPTAGLITSEGGATATFSVRLSSKPQSDVMLTFSANDSTEGTVAYPGGAAQLTFTPAAWNTLQTVTLRGANDDVADGDQMYLTSVQSITSTDAKYSGAALGALPTVLAVNQDDDSVGVSVVAAAQPLTTTELGGAATFTVVLLSEPTQDVTVPVLSNDTSEGAAAPASLVFSAANWNTPQVVTVTGQSDGVADGDIAYAVLTGPVVSTDPRYSGLTSSKVTFVNTNTDPSGIVVSGAGGGLEVSETGTSVTFQVRLGSVPRAAVTIPIVTGDPSEATVSPATLTFPDTTAATVDQTVTITGLADGLADGSQTFSIYVGPAASDDTVYNGTVGSVVMVTNLNVDAAAVVVSPTSVTTSEALGTANTATFTVTLGSGPLSDVVATFTSGDSSEGLLSTSQNPSAAPAPAVTVRFTPGSWSVQVPVTVTGQQDSVHDGDVQYLVSCSLNTTDTMYAAQACPSVTVTNQDDNVAGISPGLGGPLASAGVLLTTEAGGSATFSVVLNTQPTADVTVAVVSGAPSEGTVTPSQLVFQASGCTAGCTAGRAQWSSPQTVTVKGINDFTADGSTTYNITLNATSADLRYSSAVLATVTVLNVDQDTAGVSVAPHPVGLQWTGRLPEAGGAANVSVVLNTRPTGDVTVSLAMSDPVQAVTAPAALTFNATNWNVSQLVEISAVPDAIDDGDSTLSVRVTTASTADPSYQGLSSLAGTLARPLLSVVVVDDDTAGILAAPLSGLATTEAGGAAVFGVRLQSEPLAAVTVPLGTNDSSEGTVAPASLTFDPSNWNLTQNVTCTGVDDDVDDGDRMWLARVLPSASTDPLYNAVDAADPLLVNRDDDTFGALIEPAAALLPTGALSVSEAGTTQTFTVALTSMPLANVTVPIRSGDTTEATAAPAALHFTPAGWATKQTVTVTGVDDNIVDGTSEFIVSTGPCVSTDPLYKDYMPSPVYVAVADNDSAYVRITSIHPITGSRFTGIVGYLDTHENGTSDSFWLELSSQPKADVVVIVQSNDTSEGMVCQGDATLRPTGCLMQRQPAQIRFTPGAWSAPQLVSVSGVQDSVDDGDVIFALDIRVTTPGGVASGYEAAVVEPAAAVLGRNRDDDIAGFVVAQQAQALVTTEQGGTAQFEVVLTSQPVADVTITLKSNDTGEAVPVSAALVFSPHSTGSAGCAGGRNHWSCPQAVVVRGVQDSLADGTRPVAVTLRAVSSDAKYAALPAQVALVSNRDDDTPGVVLSTVGPFWTGLTSESRGLRAAVGVALQSQPHSNVTVRIATNDSSEGSVSPSLLTFTPADWSAPRTVTIMGEDDAEADGDVPFWVTAEVTESADSDYQGMAALSVPLRNVDNDTAQVLLQAVGAKVTTEDGGQAVVRLALRSRPVAPVTVTLSADPSAEAAAAPASVTFTAGAADWRTWRDITITGANDEIADGDSPYNVTASAASADPRYQGLLARLAGFVNRDNDVAGVTVLATEPLMVTEAGGSAQFTVALATQPRASVRVALSSSDHTEGRISPKFLEFNWTNWRAGRVVNITGVDDLIADGDVEFFAVIGPVTSADPAYHRLIAQNVAAVCSDDDMLGAVLCMLPGCTQPLQATVTEQGGTALFTFRLSSEPSHVVTAAVSSSDTSEGTVQPGALTFSAANWASPQTVTITGEQDSVADGDVPFTVVTAPLESQDPTFHGVNPPDVAVINIDDDVRGVLVTPRVLSVTEGSLSRGTTTFTVALRTQPTANVSVPISVRALTAARRAAPLSNVSASVSPSALLFTIAQWSVPQTVSVSVVDDRVAGGNSSFTVMVGPSASRDAGYDGFSFPNVSVAKLDDDEAGVVLNPQAGVSLFDAGPATMTVALSSRPLAAVTVPLSSSDQSAGTVSPALLRFTPDTWAVAQTVTIRNTPGSTAPFNLNVGPSDSPDPKYLGLPLGRDGTTGGLSMTVRRTAGAPCPWAELQLPNASQCRASTTGELSQPGQQCTVTDARSGRACQVAVCLADGTWSERQPACYCGGYSASCTLREDAASARCPAAGCDAATCCAGAGSSSDDGVPVWAIVLVSIIAFLCCLAAGVLLYWRYQRQLRRKGVGSDTASKGTQELPAQQPALEETPPAGARGKQLGPAASVPPEPGQPIEVLRGDGQWTPGVLARREPGTGAFVVSFADHRGQFEKRVRAAGWEQRLRLAAKPPPAALEDSWPQPAAYSDPDPDDAGLCEPIRTSDASLSGRGEAPADPYEVSAVPVSLREHDPAGDWLRAQTSEQLLGQPSRPRVVGAAG